MERGRRTQHSKQDSWHQLLIPQRALSLEQLGRLREKSWSVAKGHRAFASPTGIEASKNNFLRSKWLHLGKFNSVLTKPGPIHAHSITGRSLGVEHSPFEPYTQVRRIPTSVALAVACQSWIALNICFLSFLTLGKPEGVDKRARSGSKPPIQKLYLEVQGRSADPENVQTRRRVCFSGWWIGLVRSVSPAWLARSEGKWQRLQQSPECKRTYLRSRAWSCSCRTGHLKN